MTEVVALAEFVDLSAKVRRKEGEWFQTEDLRAAQLEAGGLVLTKKRFEQPWTHHEGRILSPLGNTTYTPAMPKEGDHWPHVLHLTYYDPGSSVYRYHSAMNSTAGLVSIFGRFQHANPHCDLRQLDADLQRKLLTQAFKQANVIHVHMDYRTLYHGLNRLPEKHQLLVRHYHGSIMPGDPIGRTFVQNDVDTQHEAVQVCARLYHQRYSDHIHWLPIPMPVNDYIALASSIKKPREGRPFLVAHSPTVRALKGTSFIEAAVHSLRQKGVNIELMLIENAKHGDALHRKAACDATFDSFWLGIQGSGLEGASMQQPVVAGDPSAKKDYETATGECPYTFAADREELEVVLRRLVEDTSFYEAEASRVHAYVRKYHDYPSVALRYQKIMTPFLEARGVAA